MPSLFSFVLLLLLSSAFCIQGEIKAEERGKEDVIAVVTAAGNEACRNEVALKELAVIKSAEKKKAPAE